MIFEREKILERWAEYIGDLFSDTRPPLPTPSNDRGPPILKEEVERAIRKSQGGKAPGDDGITVEMIKLLEDFGIDKLTDLYTVVSALAHAPREPRKSCANADRALTRSLQKLHNCVI